jgi:hypothetical protein
VNVTVVARPHDHSRGYPMRAFPGKPGVFVQRHGDWDRPMHVWLYRDAWRILCWPCMTSIRSGDELYDHGWPSQSAAFDAALAHCRACSVVSQ